MGIIIPKTGKVHFTLSTVFPNLLTGKKMNLPNNYTIKLFKNISPYLPKNHCGCIIFAPYG
nr:hypothetical protein [Mucilaginibacter sp. X5P1]